MFHLLQGIRVNNRQARTTGKILAYAVTSQLLYEAGAFSVLTLSHAQHRDKGKTKPNTKGPTSHTQPQTHAAQQTHKWPLVCSERGVIPRHCLNTPFIPRSGSHKMFFFSISSENREFLTTIAD
jgi:hypothetical protein